MHIAIFYETWNGQTGRVAVRIAEGLRKAGHEAVVKRCRDATPADVSAAEAVLVGSAVQMGKHHSKAVAFVKANLEVFKAKPSGFFSVSMTGRLKNAKEKEMMQKILSDFQKDSGWEPARVECVAGAILYTKYWFLVRWVMKRIAKSQGNDTDTSRDHEYTNWEQVDRFAAEFAADGQSRSLA